MYKVSYSNLVKYNNQYHNSIRIWNRTWNGPVAGWGDTGRASSSSWRTSIVQLEDEQGPINEHHLDVKTSKDLPKEQKTFEALSCFAGGLEATHGRTKIAGGGNTGRGLSQLLDEYRPDTGQVSCPDAGQARTCVRMSSKCRARKGSGKGQSLEALSQWNVWLDLNQDIELSSSSNAFKKKGQCTHWLHGCRVSPIYHQLFVCCNEMSLHWEGIHNNVHDKGFIVSDSYEMIEGLKQNWNLENVPVMNFYLWTFTSTRNRERWTKSWHTTR